MPVFIRLIKICGLVLFCCCQLDRTVAQPLPLPAAYNNANGVNFIRTWDAAAPEQNPNNLITRPLKDVRQATQYFDGLGRPLQTVVRQGSLITGGSPTDIVSPVLYDALGREFQKYLPFASTAGDGSFKLDPFQQQAAFYNTQLTGQANETNIAPNALNWAYSKTNYEVSPLNRVLSSYAPGASWAGSEASANLTDRHGVQMNYWLNTANDDVRMWSVTDVAGGWGGYTMTGPYPAGVLYKIITVDEKGSQVIEFKDKEGQVVLKKVQLGVITDDGSGTGYGDWLCTYYIYDGLNRLRSVVQPHGTELLILNGWDPTALNNDILNEQCFRYEYDGRNRMIMKKVPGAGEVYMVYDARDRLVMSQDANMRSNQQWLYTQYDVLNRSVSTGLLTDPANYNLAYYLAQASGSTAYPNLANYTTVAELSRTFYDDYSGIAAAAGSQYSTKDNSYDTYFPAASNSNWPYPQTLTASAATRGMVTGAKIKVLTAATQYFYSASFYDDKGRIIQTQSSNISNGVDINTTQYSFSGQPLMTVQKQAQAGAGAQTNVVLSQLTYDDMGRLAKTEKKISNSQVNGGNLPADWTATAENQYDALGQLKNKKLSPGFNNGAGLETLSYDYNIRGWLLGINKGYLGSSSTASAYFGMELGYDKDGYTGNGSKQYNGNIGASVWRSQGDGVQRKYEYGYDNASRLLKADFTQQESGGWNNGTVNFNVKMGDGITPTTAYDANGNIKAMQQWGLKISGSALIDDLKYSYYDNSNKLKSVQDVQNDALTRLGDFKTSALHPQNAAKQAAVTDAARALITDYTYDANGNMRRDYNKDIGDATVDGIQYNYLNLPAVITVKNKGAIAYTYNAGGDKLQKIVTENNATVTMNGNSYTSNITSTTTYASGLVYESKAYSNPSLATLQYTDKLQFAGQEEGRIRTLYGNAAQPNSPTAFAYDYFIKDHLGNVRMVLTEEQQVDKYPVASLEPSKVAAEQSYYDIDNTRIVSNPAGIPAYPNDNGIGNNPPDPAFATTNSTKVYQLNGSANKTGMGITLKVMAGDKVDIFGTSYYYQGNTGGPGVNAAPAVIDILAGLLGAPTGAATGAHTTAADLNNVSLVNNAVGSFIGDGSREDANYPQRPKASINYIFLDEQFRYTGGGFSPVSSTPGIKTHYSELQNKLVPKNGYVYIYCSNESPVNVFFDNLQVVHTRSPILEETHYYPFGLTMAGISSKAAGILQNKYKYNGKELQSQEFSDGLGLEWTDYGARFYDGQIGRWSVIDPMGEKNISWSSYAYVLDNPILRMDPDGRKDSAMTDAQKKIVKTGSSDPRINCHSFAWEDSKGDPNDPANRGVSSTWDNDPLNNTGDYRPLPFDESNQPGDRVMYFNVNDKGEVVATHSAVVTKVDENGNTIEVESKMGQSVQQRHHPRNVPTNRTSEASNTPDPTDAGYNQPGAAPTFTANGKTYAARVYFRYDVSKAISNPNNPNNSNKTVIDKTRTLTASGIPSTNPARMPAQTYYIKPIN